MTFNWERFTTWLWSFIVDEDDMASDSATKIPTQQSVKAYVDAAGGGVNIPGICQGRLTLRSGVAVPTTDVLVSPDLSLYQAAAASAPIASTTGAQPSDRFQTFDLTKGTLLKSVTLKLKKALAPTGNATAALYLTADTPGTDATPTGSALATFPVLDVSTLTTDYAAITFTLATAYEVPATDNYCIQLTFTGGDGTNYISWADLSGAADGQNSGARNYGGAWSAYDTYDHAIVVGLEHSLYLTPYNGNLIGLYDGASDWDVIEFAETALDISAFTASKPYDIFAYNNSGTMALEGLVWTDDTTRATALVLQDGIYVKSGATTRRHVGTIRITATTGQCEVSFGKTPAAGGSAPKCFVWNRYNQPELHFWNRDATDSYTEVAAAGGKWNYWLNSATNKFEFVVGDASLISALFSGWGWPSVAGNGSAYGIALDVGSIPSASENDAMISPGTFDGTGIGRFAERVGAGFHTLTLLEFNNAGSDLSYYGDGGASASNLQSGAEFIVWA